MKKFKCIVTREDEYIIEFDENEINEEWMTDFKKHFYNFDSLEEHAEHIAQFRSRFPDDSFIEGYGIPTVNGRRPVFADKDSVIKAINIKIISEDQNIDVEVEKI